MEIVVSDHHITSSPNFALVRQVDVHGAACRAIDDAYRHCPAGLGLVVRPELQLAGADQSL